MNYLDFYKGKTVLVTGDTGFKGSWLSIWLKELGAEVIGFGLPAKAEDNYTVCGLKNEYLHLNKDIRNYDILAAIDEHRPTIVFHLAAQALVMDSYENPYYTFDTNVRGTLNVLDAVKNNPSVKAAVMITSDKCYQNTGEVHAYREDDPLGGRDPYSASKSAAEMIIQSYIWSFRGGANIASARAGNVIGGGDWSKNRIIPDCIRALRDDNRILIRNPDSIRPWQYVLEPLYGYLMLGKLLCNDRVGGSYTGAWNFGSFLKSAMSVQDLVTELIRIWGSGAYQVVKNQSQKEAGILLLNSERANHYLDWHTVLNINKMLEFTVDEYQNPTLENRRTQIKRYMGLRA